MANSGFGHEQMRRVNLKTYNEIYHPHLSRRQKLAFNAFIALNRERDYLQTGIGSTPLAIKRREIKAQYDRLPEPIAYRYFEHFIITLDDAYIEQNISEARAKLDG